MLLLLPIHYRSIKLDSNKEARLHMKRTEELKRRQYLEARKHALSFTPLAYSIKVILHSKQYYGDTK